MTRNDETPRRGQPERGSKWDSGLTNRTTSHSPRQLPRLHPLARRALDNLKYDLLRQNQRDLTVESAVRAVEFILKNC
jgi:hypothetical protein